MSDLFHVFIERPRSESPDAASTLARAIAARYGIATADLEARLAAGRFRVKGNVDRTTADQFAQDLTRLGAVCTVASASAPPPASGTKPVSLPVVERAPAPPPPARPSTMPSVERVAAPARPSTLPKVERVASPEAPIASDLGALSGEFPLTLSTLDGASEDEARASRKIQLPASFGPPPDEPAASASRKMQLPASFGPAPERVEDAGSGGVDVSMDDGAGVEVFDPFAPPEAQANAPELMLAVDRPSRKSMAAEAAHAAAASASHGSSHGAPAPAVPPVLPARATVAPPAAPAGSMRMPAARPAGGVRALLRDDGVRFLAGVAIAFALGAAPALLVGSARETAAFGEIHASLERQHAEAAQSRVKWDSLDRVRATHAERKRGERQAIAITTILMWAAISGVIGWLWFRKIDWDRVLA